MALVGVLAAIVTLAVPVANHAYGGLNHTLRVVTTLAATALAMWISQLRVERTVQLRTARFETRNERRRRVAAEMNQRMQTMARALNTAVDPVQVADAVFAALRDELQVDAATFALLDERGRLQTLRRFGYDPDDRADAVLAALRPDGPVLKANDPLFAGSRTELRRQRPDVFAVVRASPFHGPGRRAPRRLGPHHRGASSPGGLPTGTSPSRTAASSSPSPGPRPRRSSGRGSP